jgi:hypothetical protein
MPLSINIWRIDDKEKDSENGDSDENGDKSNANTIAR